MTTVLYILMAALVFFIIGYLFSKIGCESNTERYLGEAPVDPVTSDSGKCEDTDIPAVQKSEADIQAAKLAEEAQAKADEEATQARAAQEQKEADAEAKKAEKARAQEADKEKAMQAVKEKEAAARANVESQEAATEEAKGDKVDKKNTKDDAAATEANAGTAPEGLLDAPRNGKKDNLTKIKGIGIKIDEALNGIGVYHFDQIAAWNEDNMAWADSQLAFPGRAKRDDWVGQAKDLAEGKETEFSKRVEKGQVASSKKA